MNVVKRTESLLNIIKLAEFSVGKEGLDMSEVCKKCGKELKIAPCKVGTSNFIATQFICEEHGLIKISGMLYDEAKLHYKELEA